MPRLSVIVEDQPFATANFADPTAAEPQSENVHFLFDSQSHCNKNKLHRLLSSEDGMIRAAKKSHRKHEKLLKHKDKFHLQFEASNSHKEEIAMQLSGDGTKPHLHCFPVEKGYLINVKHQVQIVGHSSKNYICAGDEISFVRGDGKALRLNSNRFSKTKLVFSAKIDLKAKFVISGLANGTKITSSTAFSLTASAVESLSVGFVAKEGKLSVFKKKKGSKTEPVQFFIKL